jgi:CelD/BcsL family acetyltransferase involved in cellulose biosynthesis
MRTAGTPDAPGGGARDLAIAVTPLPDIAELAGEWRLLEQRAEPSFFLSWGWIGCWLRHLPPSVEPLLMRAGAGGRTVALGIVVPRTDWRHGVIRSRGLHLHETGQPDLDRLAIEYNGLLLDRQAGEIEGRCFAELLRVTRADELHLSGVGRQRLAAIEQLGLRWRLRDREPVPVIDLDRLREAGGGFERMLGASTRRQLRRSRRWYEAQGTLRIAAATNVAEALATLDELKDLHQRLWRARGRPGAFASGFFEGFHRDLVAGRFAAGEIQLLRIAAGAATIGCLYNFVHAGRVYYYQSGFAYTDRPAIKPGLVCHALAVQWNIERGAATYDLLAGASRFKRSIANDCGELLWLSVQKDRLRFRIENAARQLKSAFGTR